MMQPQIQPTDVDPEAAPSTWASILKRRFKRARIKKEQRVWLTALGVAGLIAGLRVLGLLQSLELEAYDQMVRLRPARPSDGRVVIISIDDADINHLQAWPISDALMAELLGRVRTYEPLAIGLDIYRELPVPPGQEELQQIFQTTPNLIGIEKIPDVDRVGVEPPPLLQPQQIGFNNVVVDSDGNVRRALLFWTVDGQAHTSFALRLASLYLEEAGIEPRPADSNPQYLQLGQGVFRPLQPSDGGYVRADTGGYQILTDFHTGRNAFVTVSLRDVLAGQVDGELFRDRIVLIGSTAVSLKDFFYTPQSGGLVSAVTPIPGVELHAKIISQILDAAQGEQSLMRYWPAPAEWLWILLWAWAGASLSWRLRSPEKSLVAVVLAGIGLTGTAYLTFIAGWWIPLVPPMLAMSGAVIGITGYIAHLEEELKKSKEFLNSVINTIPDPIFVKDKSHRWIVLNEAFCRLMGQPIDNLLGKSERDILSAQQANAFWQQDELTFSSGSEHEHEEELTTNGSSYSMATKRSLHRDAAGNLFLVGVIRDITQRKQMEEELRRTAAELVRSNTELRQAEDRLRQMAYHDTLTGLPNRKLLEERLSQALDWARKYDQLVALLFLDLDGFKSINDTYGHQMGDMLLKAVSQRLIGCLRGSDTVSRLGGDEFVVLLPAIPSQADISRVAEKILMTLSQNFILTGTSISITTSIGISIYPLDGDEASALMARADGAMYCAKDLGKHQYTFAVPGTIGNLEAGPNHDQPQSSCSEA